MLRKQGRSARRLLIRYKRRWDRLWKRIKKKGKSVDARRWAALVIALVILGPLAWSARTGWKGKESLPQVYSRGEVPQQERSKSRFALEARMGVFLPQSKSLRGNHGEVWPEYTVSLLYHLEKRWDVVAALSYTEKKFKSDGIKERFKMIPFSLQLRYNYINGRHVKGYIGAGPRWLTCWDTFSGKVLKNNYQTALEGYVETGLLGCIRDRYLIDLYVGYSFGRLAFAQRQENFAPATILTSGLHAGLGLGVKF